MNSIELLKQYVGNLSELRKIISSLDLIPNEATDDFDNLNQKLLKQLDKAVDKEKVSRIIKSELIVTYGLFDNDFDTSLIVDTIIGWWNSKL